MLGMLAAYNGTMAVISDSDWEKLTGPHALVFGVVIAVGILWFTLIKVVGAYHKRMVAREKTEAERQARDDEARERRHKEAMEMQSSFHEKMLKVSTESILSIERSTAAIKGMKRALDYQTQELRKRSCLLGHIGKAEVVDGDMEGEE